jgi:hypothetical protein
MSRLLIPSLIAGAALAATIYWEAQTIWEPDAGAMPRRPVSATLASAPPKQTPADPVEAWVTTSLERPLLRDSRRPDKAAAEAQRKGNEAPRLAGVVTGPFGNRAIFVMPGSPKPVVATEGAQVGNFVIRSIEPGRVVVESDAGLRTYRPLFAEKDPPPSPTAKRINFRPGKG